MHELLLKRFKYLSILSYLQALISNTDDKRISANNNSIEQSLNFDFNFTWKLYFSRKSIEEIAIHF